MKSRIYNGNVMHTRLEPVKHSFRYPVYMYAFDLDELEELNNTIHWFGYNHFAPVSIYDKDYLHEGSEPLKEKLLAYLKDKDYVQQIKRIELVTSARYFHYVFNPVSFYYCYDNQDQLVCIAAEVNNTFHERHLYVLDQPDEITCDQTMRFIRPKAFHVSPFNDMKGEYDFHFHHLNGNLDVHINILREQQPVFFSRLWGTAVPLTSVNLKKNILRYPITAWLNMPRILKEAAMLYYQKHLPVYSKPFPSSSMTIRVAKPTFWQRLVMNKLFDRLQTIQTGRLELELPDGHMAFFGKDTTAYPIKMKIKNYRFFSKLMSHGAIGLGESYVDGDWESNDVTELLQFFIQNIAYLQEAALGKNRFKRMVYRFHHLLNKNTQRGSKKNIHNHYDIGNAFYQLILDASMMYSSAYFNTGEDSIETAQLNKMHKLIQKAQIHANDHVLEIGSGWGSMAIEMVKTTGCRVTTITVSKEQYDLAQQRIHEAGLNERIDIRLCDYRNLEGMYDKIVSIEMIEAVGHEYLGTYFSVCDRVLKPHGIIALQAITIPDHRYESYRRNSDWIQQYIFPGAVVPSLTALCNAMTAHSKLIVEHVENIGIHYAKTLHIWKENLLRQQENVIKLGMDERFIRTWIYYFSYCEAAFASRHLNNLQIVLTRQNNSTLPTSVT